MYFHVFNYIHIVILLQCMPVDRVHAVPEEASQKAALASPGTGVINGCGLPCGCLGIDQTASALNQGATSSAPKMFVLISPSPPLPSPPLPSLPSPPLSCFVSSPLLSLSLPPPLPLPLLYVFSLSPSPSSPLPSLTSTSYTMHDLKNCFYVLLTLETPGRIEPWIKHAL